MKNLITILLLAVFSFSGCKKKPQQALIRTVQKTYAASDWLWYAGTYSNALVVSCPIITQEIIDYGTVKVEASQNAGVFSALPFTVLATNTYTYNYNYRVGEVAILRENINMLNEVPASITIKVSVIPGTL